MATLEIGGGIDEHLVDAVDMDVLGGNVVKIDVVDPGAGFDVASHARRGYDIVDGPVGMGFQLVVVGRFTCQLTTDALATLGIHLGHALNDLEQTGTTTDAIGLQRRRYGQTDGLVGSALVSHYQIGGQGVEPSVHALNRSVERLQVDGDIGATGRGFQRFLWNFR